MSSLGQHGGNEMKRQDKKMSYDLMSTTHDDEMVLTRIQGQDSC